MGNDTIPKGWLKPKLSQWALLDMKRQKLYALFRGATRLGKSPENNIRINHKSCSKYHASIRARGSIIHYHDFSRVGSYVMKRTKYNLIKNETTRIYESSELQIATSWFKVTKLGSISVSEEEESDEDKTDDEINYEEIMEKIEKEKTPKEAQFE